MNIQTIVKLSAAGVVLVAALVFFLLEFKKGKKISFAKIVWLLIAVGALVYAGATGYKVINNRKLSAKQNYMSCLLIDLQDYSQARSIAEQAYSRTENSQSANLILLSLCYQNRYEICVDEARSYLADHKGDAMASKIYDLSVAARDGEEIKESQLILLLGEIKDSLNLSQKEKEHAVTLVNVQRATSIDFSIETVQSDLLTLSSQNDALSLKAKAQAALVSGDTAEAVQLAEKAVKADPTPANVAALALSASQLPGDPETDGEIRGLNEKISAAYTEQYELQDKYYAEENESKRLQLEEKIEKKQEEINDLITQLDAVSANRAINYLLARKGLFGEEDPATQIVLSKLYYQAGQEEEATANIQHFLTADSSFGNLSAEKTALIDAYDQAGTADDESVRMVSDEIFASVGQGLSDKNIFYQYDYSRNQTFADFLTSAIEKLRSGLLVSRVNTDNYPEVEVYVSVSEEKEDGSPYGKKDFEAIDFGVEVSNFEVVAPDGELQADLSICLVVDQSGSMEGSNLANAKQAVSNFVRNVPDGVPVGLVSFSHYAVIRCPVTDSTTTIDHAINSLYADGGTNIASGLQAASDALQGFSGTRIIIVMSDGEDGSEPEYMEQTIQSLVSQGIIVYSVGFGSAQSAYMSNISQRTGGKFLRAEEAGSLTDIYNQISKFVVNNYIIRFTVTEQPDEYQRSLRIALENGVYDEKDYIVGPDPEQMLKEDELSPLSDFYQQIGGSYKGKLSGTDE